MSASDLERWNRIAPTYGAAIGGDDDSFYRRFVPFLQLHLGDRLQGQRLLDLGYGHGWLGARLAAAGATVTGVDGSQALIKQARSAYPKLDWHAHDLTRPLPDSWGQFDAVLAHMVLMDVPDLNELLASVARLLNPDRTFLLTILHPSFFNHPIVEELPNSWTRTVRGYLDHETWHIDSFGGHRHYHRPLAWYVQQLRTHGFAIADLDEPPTLPHHTRPTNEWTEYERWLSRLPTMLSLACRLISDGRSALHNF